MNECEESRKIQKIFFSLQPKECFQIYQFFFKEREKSFLQNSSQYKKTRTLAHALARTRKRASSEEEEGEEGVVVVFGHFLVAQIKFIA